MTETLADFVVCHPGRELPTLIRAQVHERYTWLVALACAGADQPEVALLADTLSAFGDGEDAGLLGVGRRLGPCEAPVVNAFAMEAGATSIGRSLPAWPDGPVLSAALAAAELRGQGLVDCLDAVTLGAEIGLRVEAALQPGLTESGWRRFAVASRIGAAAAAGRLLGLSSPQMVSVLGLAATQVSARASSTTSLGWARAAGDGVEAALLVQAGMTGPAAPLEGRRGLAQVLARTNLEDTDPLDRLGLSWLVGDLPTVPEDLSGSWAIAARRAADGFSEEHAWTSLYAACEAIRVG